MLLTLIPGHNHKEMGQAPQDPGTESILTQVLSECTSGQNETGLYSPKSLVSTIREAGHADPKISPFLILLGVNSDSGWTFLELHHLTKYVFGSTQIALVIRRLPHAKVRHLHRLTTEENWGVEVEGNRVS